MGNTQYEERLALGTKIGISIHSTHRAEVKKLFAALWQEILLFEKRCSRFLPASELTVFNDNAGVKRAISPEFRDILVQAKQLAMQTDGLFNPFILPALQKLGYKQSFLHEYSGDPVHDYSNHSVANVRELEIGDTWARIPYGTAIELGGCGKGYIGDRLAGIVESSDSVEGYWLSLGGDVVVGGQQANGELTCVRVARGGVGNVMIASVQPDSVERFAVATSTVSKRRGTHKGKQWHHIIDPRTLQPAMSDVTTATICGDSLIQADVHAANMIILGSHDARAYIRKQQISDALLQDADGRPLICTGIRIELDSGPDEIIEDAVEPDF